MFIFLFTCRAAPQLRVRPPDQLAKKQVQQKTSEEKEPAVVFSSCMQGIVCVVVFVHVCVRVGACMYTEMLSGGVRQRKG